MVDPLDGDRENENPGENTEHDDMFLCRMCSRHIEKFFKLGSLFCPYCGAAINPGAMTGSTSKDSNPVSGRAYWSVKWSILAVPISMGFLILATVIFGVVLVIPIILADPAGFLNDPGALADRISEIMMNPYATALLSFAELILLVAPLILVKKYQKPIGKRLQLLGWRPYRKSGEVNQEGLNRLVQDVIISLIIAFAMVGFQFLLTLGNDAFWSLFLPIDPLQDAFSGVDQSITPADPLQLIALVASMVFLIGPTEEFLFRGYTQQGLESKLGERKALIITAFLFTAVHIITGIFAPIIGLYMFLPYFGLSLVFCAIYMRTKNLNRLILIHGIYDAMLVLYGYVLTGAGEVPALVYIFTSFGVLIVVFIYVIYIFVFRKKSTTSEFSSF